MIILRRKSNGEVKEYPLTDEQYAKIAECLSDDIECISCQLHHNEGTPTKEKKSIWRNKPLHIGIHLIFTCFLFSIPFLLPRLHVDPTMLMGASGLWTSAYTLLYSYKLDKEGLKVK